MRATLLGLIDYLVLLVLPGADMLLMDWVAVGEDLQGWGLFSIAEYHCTYCESESNVTSLHLDQIKIEINVGFLQKHKKFSSFTFVFLSS